MRTISFIGVAACSVVLLSGCATSSKMSKADKSFAKQDYEQAITQYKADVAKSKDAAAANYRIGEAYRLSNRIDQAEPFYKAAIDGGAHQPDLGYRYAEALKANGKSQEAASQFSTYAQSGGNPTLVTAANSAVQSSQASVALAAKPALYDVAPLDGLNTPSSEYSATQMPGTKELVFASGREGKTFPGNGENYTSLYAQKFDDANTMTGGTTRKLESQFNNPKELQASATYTPDGKTMVFARSNDGSKKGYLSVDLWVSYFRNGAWTEPVLANINDRSADDFSPAFASDGTTLYFSSARSGGQGGNDIYKSTLGSDGRFSPAVNLGTPVNTPGNENFPGVAPDGTLYFSSDGHPGFGKLDIFKFQDGQVTNLRSGINTVGDDFAPYFTGSNMGVLSSNRAGGKGSDDLYSFHKKPRKLATFIADGTVLERNPKTGVVAPLAGATITVTGRNGQKQDVMSGPDGKFTAKLDSAQTYELAANHTYDILARTNLTTPTNYPEQDALPLQQNDIKLPVSLTMEKIIINRPVVIRDIFYDYDKSDIRPDAAVRLDTLVSFLQDNPSISVELGSHTDQRGADAYNLKLSQARAESAVAYIVSKGISKSRITAKGYGESQPIVKNATTEAEYQLNRRTEFKITHVKVAPVKAAATKHAPIKKKRTK